MCGVWRVHTAYSKASGRGPHFLPFIRAGMAADGNRALMPLPKQVEEVVYWTNPLVSGGVFLVGLFAFYLVGLCNYSSISVVCYVLILNLTVRSGSSSSSGRASTTSTRCSHTCSRRR